MYIRILTGLKLCIRQNGFYKRGTEDPDAEIIPFARVSEYKKKYVFTIYDEKSSSAFSQAM